MMFVIRGDGLALNHGRLKLDGGVIWLLLFRKVDLYRAIPCRTLAICDCDG
jgi:hypothetical protein